MKDMNSIDHFMTQTLNVVNMCRAHGEDVSNQKVIQKVLRNLPMKFDMVITTIEESINLA